jgi:hypothetical protein
MPTTTKTDANIATIKAEPFDLKFNPKTTALVIIDMQCDFVLSGGFGEKLGNGASRPTCTRSCSTVELRPSSFAK